MSVNNFIPTIWSARLLTALNKQLVYAQAGVVNRDYEGEIKQAGNSVKINSIGDVTVKTYTKNTDIDAPETLVDSSQMLNITEQKYFNFAVDSVDKAQANVSLIEEAMRRAAQNLRDAADQFIADMYVDVPSDNFIGSDDSPKSISSVEKAYDYLVDLGVKLDEANVPNDGRFAIVPSWFYGLMQKDDRFVAAGTSKTDQVLANGFIGEAADFKLYKSNNVPNVSKAKYKILAGHPMACSYAEQIVEVEAYKPEKRFGDAIKGLHVYGGKLVRPYAWAVLVATNAVT